MDEESAGCVFLIFGVYVLGMCLAVVVSWEANHSVGWSSLDGILSWIYILFHFVIRPVTSG